MTGTMGPRPRVRLSQKKPATPTRMNFVAMGRIRAPCRSNGALCPGAEALASPKPRLAVGQRVAALLRFGWQASHGLGGRLRRFTQSGRLSPQFGQYGLCCIPRRPSGYSGPVNVRARRYVTLLQSPVIPLRMSISIELSGAMRIIMAYVVPGRMNGYRQGVTGGGITARIRRCRFVGQRT